MRAACPNHFVRLDLITLTILDQEYKLLNSLLCCFLQNPVASSLLRPKKLCNMAVAVERPVCLNMGLTKWQLLILTFLCSISKPDDPALTFNCWSLLQLLSILNIAVVQKPERCAQRKANPSCHVSCCHTCCVISKVYTPGRCLLQICRPVQKSLTSRMYAYSRPISGSHLSCSTGPRLPAGACRC